MSVTQNRTCTASLSVLNDPREAEVVSVRLEANRRLPVEGRVPTRRRPAYRFGRDPPRVRESQVQVECIALCCSWLFPFVVNTVAFAISGDFCLKRMQPMP
jgi:hypothetical protein